MGGWVGDVTHMGVEVSAGVAHSLDEMFQFGLALYWAAA
jgi:hypothetical protein